jgi:hypothetical protein
MIMHDTTATVKARVLSAGRYLRIGTGVNRRGLPVSSGLTDIGDVAFSLRFRLIGACLLMASSALAAPAAKYLQEQTRLQSDRVADLQAQRLRRNRRMWLVSVPVLIAGNVLDAQSSWGKPETNGLLQGASGRFDGRGAAIKFSITGALLAGQFAMTRMLRRNPESLNSAYVGWSASNLIYGSALGGIALHNYRIHSTGP